MSDYDGSSNTNDQDNNSPITYVEIKVDGGKSINVNFQDLVRGSNTFCRKAFEKDFETVYDYGSTMHYSSVLNFFKAIKGTKPKITRENVFEYQKLCDEWEATPQIRAYADSYFQESESLLLIPKMLFKISHKDDLTEEIQRLSNNIISFLDDPNLLKLPLDVFIQCLDFHLVQDDTEGFQKLFKFCLSYLDQHKGEKTISEIFSKLNIGKLSLENMHQLCSRPYFDRSVLNDSCGTFLRVFQELSIKGKDIIEKCEAELLTMEKFNSENESSKKEIAKLLETTEKQKAMIDGLLSIVNRIPIPLDQGQQYQPNENTICYPNWSAKQSINNSGSASQNGWIYSHAYCGNSSSHYLQIQGCSALNFCGSNQATCNNYESIFVPIENSQSFTLSGSYFQQNNLIPEMPNKYVNYPDWSKAKMINWGSTVQIIEDGWIYAECGYTSTYIYLTINNNFNFLITANASSYMTFSSVFVPVSSNSQITLTNASRQMYAFFVPAKTNSYVNRPNWGNNNTEKSWNTNYIAEENGWLFAQATHYKGAGNYDIPYLYIDGTRFLITHNESTYSLSSVFVPIERGQNYKAIGGYTQQSLYFIPSK